MDGHGVFYQISNLIKGHSLNEAYPNLLYETYIQLKNDSITHVRETYRLIDILGDLGGVIEILMLVLGTFLFPISEHSFILKALQKLYLARTRDKQLLELDDQIKIDYKVKEND